MSDFTLLTREQCFEWRSKWEEERDEERDEEWYEGKKTLDILKKRGIKAEITDFSILLGGEKASKDGTGAYWTRTNDGGIIVCSRR